MTSNKKPASRSTIEGLAGENQINRSRSKLSKSCKRSRRVG